MDEEAGALISNENTTAANESQVDHAAEHVIELQPSEEGRRVIELEEEFWQSVPAVGTTCYAIDYQWWESWCAYTGVRIENRKNASVVVRHSASKD